MIMANQHNINPWELFNRTRGWPESLRSDKLVRWGSIGEDGIDDDVVLLSDWDYGCWVADPGVDDFVGVCEELGGLEGELLLQFLFVFWMAFVFLIPLPLDDGQGGRERVCVNEWSFDLIESKVEYSIFIFLAFPIVFVRGLWVFIIH